MRHLLTTLAAARLVMGLGLEVAPASAQAAPLPQLNGPSTQASPVENVGYYYRRYGYYPYRGYYWRFPGITGPTTTAITGRIATAIGGGPIIAVTGSLIWIDQDRSGSRRS
jgi:hypothetical protein